MSYRPWIDFKIHIISYNLVTPEPNFIKLKTDIYHYKTLMYAKFGQAGFGSSWAIALELI